MRMVKKHFWKIVALVVIVVIGVSIFYSKQAAEQANEGVSEVETHVKGNPEAAVTLVEYSDFQCPACGQFYPYIEDIVNLYQDDLRFEYRHFPLITIHPNALPAAIASEAAGQQGRFWEMYDILFENQSAWAEASNARAYFVQYASELGLDVDMFKRHLDSSILENSVMDSFNDARSQGFSGTPTLLLNGEKMEIETFDDFKAQIETAINETKTTTE